MLDQIDGPFLQKLHEEWSSCPPIRMVVAAFAGIKPEEKGSRNFMELAGMFPDGAIH